MDVVPPRNVLQEMKTQEQEDNRVVAKVVEEAREPSYTLANMIKQD